MLNSESAINYPPFEFISHTADVRICSYGRTLEELFVNSLKAIYSILKKDYSKTNKLSEEIEIKVKSFDNVTLLIDFLSEVLTQVYINKAILECQKIIFKGENELSAYFDGYKQDFFDKDVKAITYHEAEINIKDGLFSAKFILDI